MADDLIRYVIELTPQEAGIVAARANSWHESPGEWIARVVRKRIATGQPLTPRQASLIELHSQKLDDRAIALALGIPKAYAADCRRRLGLAANPRRKASA